MVAIMTVHRPFAHTALALAALLMAAHLPTAHAHARWVCPVPRSTNTGIKVRAHSAATNGTQRRGAPPAHPR